MFWNAVLQGMNIPSKTKWCRVENENLLEKMISSTTIEYPLASGRKLSLNVVVDTEERVSPEARRQHKKYFNSKTR